MASPFVDSLLAKLAAKQASAEEALKQASAAAQSPLPPDQEQRVRELIWTLEQVISIGAGLGPWLKRRPSDQAADWVEGFYRSRKANQPRTPHYDADIEDVLQVIGL